MTSGFWKYGENGFSITSKLGNQKGFTKEETCFCCAFKRKATEWWVGKQRGTFRDNEPA